MGQAASPCVTVVADVKCCVGEPVTRLPGTIMQPSTVLGGKGLRQEQAPFFLLQVRNGPHTTEPNGRLLFSVEQAGQLSSLCFLCRAASSGLWQRSLWFLGRTLPFPAPSLHQCLIWWR